MGAALEDPRTQGSRWLLVTKVTLALLLLNFLTSFSNVWSTPYIQPDMRVGLDFVALWLVLLLLVALFGRVGPRAVKWLAILFTVVVIGRYVDVTVPAWFGRKVNLYWDAQHLPTFLDVASQEYVWWQLLGILAAFVAGLWLLARLIRTCIQILAQHAAPYALRSPAAWVVTVGLVGLVGAGLMKVEGAGSYVAEPVFPVFKRQAHLLAAAFFPDRFRSELPASPSLESDLQVLRGAEVKVLFLESYGAATYERDDLYQAIQPGREKLERAANAQGRQVLSAFV